MEFLQIKLCTFLESMATQGVKNVYFICQKYKKLIMRGKKYLGSQVVKGQQEEEYKSIQISYLHPSIFIHGKKTKARGTNDGDKNTHYAC